MGTFQAYKNQVSIQTKSVSAKWKRSHGHVSPTSLKTNNHSFDQMPMVNVNKTSEELPLT